MEDLATRLKGTGDCSRGTQCKRYAAHQPPVFECCVLLLLLVLLFQIFPTLQEPLRNMKVNRAKFAGLAQSCMNMAGDAAAADDVSSDSTAGLVEALEAAAAAAEAAVDEASAFAAVVATAEAAAAQLEHTSLR